MARSLPALTAALAALLIAAPAAGAHSLVRVGDGVLFYISVDEVSLNQLTVTRNGAEIELRDPPAYQGMDIGPCRPGDVTNDVNAYVIQAFCRAAGITRVRVELGNREDTATVLAGVPAQVLGGEGADTLTTGPEDDAVDGGPGNDTIATGEGNDIVIGGNGVDDIDAGPGDDDIRVRDGFADTVRCGPGNDRVDADEFDTLAPDCEGVERVAVPPPPDADLAATDVTPPRVDVGALTRQRLGKGVFRVAATSSERGTLGASGFIAIAGVRYPLTNVSRPVRVPGAGVELRVKLTKRLLRQARRALARKRKVTVHLSVVGTDAAGNSRPRRAPRITVVPR
jgi:hypothetical protein